MRIADFHPAALWRSLFDTSQRKHVYLGKALVADLPVTFLVSFVAGSALGFADPSIFAQYSNVELATLTCLVAPCLETALMVLIFAALRIFTRREEILTALSALIWGLLHAPNGLAWGVTSFWPFFLYSICYLQWEKRGGTRAFAMTSAFHALHNAVPTVVIVTFRT